MISSFSLHHPFRYQISNVHDCLLSHTASLPKSKRCNQRFQSWLIQESFWLELNSFLYKIRRFFYLFRVFKLFGVSVDQIQLRGYQSPSPNRTITNDRIFARLSPKSLRVDGRQSEDFLETCLRTRRSPTIMEALKMGVTLLSDSSRLLDLPVTVSSSSWMLPNS